MRKSTRKSSSTDFPGIKRRYGVVALLAGLALVATACGTDSGSAEPPGETDTPADEAPADDGDTAAEDQPAADGEPILVGMTNALTGPYSEFGQAGLKSVELAIETWNENGGINGRPLELITYDDQLAADRALPNMQRLIEEDGVHLVIGPSGSGPTLAVVDYVESHDVPMVNSIAQTVTITYPDGYENPPRPNLFNFALQNDVEAEFMAEALAELGFERPGLLGESTPYGATGIETIAEVLEADHGIEAVGLEEYNQGDPDVTSQLARLDRAGADAIVLVGLGADAATVRTGMLQLGLEQPLIGSMGVPTGPYHNLLDPEAVAGTVAVLFSAFADWGEGTREEAQNVADRWFEKYGNDEFYGPGDQPGEYFGHTMGWYDATDVLFQAVERAGSTDVGEIQAVLESGDVFPSSRDDYTFSPTRHHAVTSDALGLFEYYLQDDGTTAVRPYTR